MQSTGMLVFWFVFIVAMIPLSLYLLKKSGLAPARLGAGGAVLKTVAQLPLGPGQRLVTVEVGEGEGRTWLVLGVTSQAISVLHQLPPSQAVDPASSEGGPGAAEAKFPTLLRRASNLAGQPKA